MAWLTIVVSAGKNSEESELARHTSNMVLKCSCILLYPIVGLRLRGLYLNYIKKIVF